MFLLASSLSSPQKSERLNGSSACQRFMTPADDIDRKTTRHQAGPDGQWLGANTPGYLLEIRIGMILSLPVSRAESFEETTALYVHSKSIAFDLKRSLMQWQGEQTLSGAYALDA